MNRTRIAYWLFVVGAIGFAGSLFFVSITAYPVQYLIMFILMAPYVFLKFREGYQSVQ